MPARFALAGGTLTGGTLTNNNNLAGFGTVNSLIVNAGSLIATNGTLSALGGLTNTAAGLIACGTPERCPTGRLQPRHHRRGCRR